MSAHAIRWLGRYGSEADLQKQAIRNAAGNETVSYGRGRYRSPRWTHGAAKYQERHSFRNCIWRQNRSRKTTAQAASPAMAT